MYWKRIVTERSGRRAAPRQHGKRAASTFARSNSRHEVGRPALGLFCFCKAFCFNMPTTCRKGRAHCCLQAWEANLGMFSRFWCGGGVLQYKTEGRQRMGGKSGLYGKHPPRYIRAAAVRTAISDRRCCRRRRCRCNPKLLRRHIAKSVSL